LGAPDVRNCRVCDAAITGSSYRHYLCADCYGENAKRLSVGAPRKRRVRLTCRDVGLDVDRISQLISLVDPGASNDAADAAQWLIKCQSILQEVAANG
jgi:hypothetical protein